MAGPTPGQALSARRIHPTGHHHALVEARSCGWHICGCAQVKADELTIVEDESFRVSRSNSGGFSIAQRTMKNMSTHSVVIRLSVACATLLTVLLVAGCGTSTTPGYGVSAPIKNSALVTQSHNQADVTFVTNMSSHSSQAVAMSQLAPDHGGDAQVKDMAARIQTGQQAAIDQMKGFMQVWNSSALPLGGSQAPALSPRDQGGLGESTMPTMTSPQTLTQLRSATGPRFDTMFLQMMVAHHLAAIAMSETEVSAGLNPDAKALAQRIIDVQQSEITQMRAIERRLDHGSGGW